MLFKLLNITYYYIIIYPYFGVFRLYFEHNTHSVRRWLGNKLLVLMIVAAHVFQIKSIKGHNSDRVREPNYIEKFVAKRL